jgi:hypothetical protein
MAKKQAFSAVMSDFLLKTRPRPLELYTKINPLATLEILGASVFSPRKIWGLLEMRD